MRTEKKTAKLSEKRPPSGATKSERRRMELLDLSIKAFAEKGIGAANHADVAKSAGVVVGTVFAYFPNKQALLHDALVEVGQVVTEDIGQTIEPSDLIESMLTKSAEKIVEIAQTRPHCIRLWIMWGVVQRARERALYRTYEETLIARLADVVARNMPEGTDAQYIRDRARLILGAGEMLMRLVLDQAEQQRIDMFVRHVQTTLMAPLLGPDRE